MEPKELKKAYQDLEDKFKLPNFEKINKDFEIDKIDRDSEFLLRIIRKTMMEKIVNSLGFIEMLLNPVNAPIIYMPYLKTMSQEDKEKISKMHTSLAELSVDSLALEIETSEKHEAELIKKIFSIWDSIKPEFKAIIANIRNPKESKAKEKSYFG